MHLWMWAWCCMFQMNLRVSRWILLSCMLLAFSLSNNAKYGFKKAIFLSTTLNIFLPHDILISNLLLERFQSYQTCSGNRKVFGVKENMNTVLYRFKKFKEFTYLANFASSKEVYNLQTRNLFHECQISLQIQFFDAFARL